MRRPSGVATRSTGPAEVARRTPPPRRRPRGGPARPASRPAGPPAAARCGSATARPRTRARRRAAAATTRRRSPGSPRSSGAGRRPAPGRRKTEVTFGAPYSSTAAQRHPLGLPAVGAGPAIEERCWVIEVPSRADPPVVDDLGHDPEAAGPAGRPAWWSAGPRSGPPRARTARPLRQNVACGTPCSTRTRRRGSRAGRRSTTSDRAGGAAAASRAARRRPRPRPLPARDRAGRRSPSRCGSAAAPAWRSAAGGTTSSESANASRSPVTWRSPSLRAAPSPLVVGVHARGPAGRGRRTPRRSRPRRRGSRRPPRPPRARFPSVSTGPAPSRGRRAGTPRRRTPAPRR